MKKFYYIILILLLSLTVYCQQSNEATVTLKEYIDKQTEYLMRISDIRYDNIENNVRTATAALEKRLDGVNEFRAQLKDQVATFPTRNELWGYIVAVAGLIFGYANFKKNQQNGGGKNIQSGDNVKVEK